MYNLYSITRSQEAMRRLFATARNLTGNLPPQPDVFPDQLAPIVRAADGERQLDMMRWGMPDPPWPIGTGDALRHGSRMSTNGR